MLHLLYNYFIKPHPKIKKKNAYPNGKAFSLIYDSDKCSIELFYPKPLMSIPMINAAILIMQKIKAPIMIDLSWFITQSSFYGRLFVLRNVPVGDNRLTN